MIVLNYIIEEPVKSKKKKRGKKARNKDREVFQIIFIELPWYTMLCSHKAWITLNYIGLKFIVN